MTGACLSDQVLLLLNLCLLWLRRSTRGNVGGAVAVGVVYCMENRMKGGEARVWFFLKIKRKGEDKGEIWRARSVGLLVRFGG